MRWLFAASLIVLTACGVDGEPSQPGGVSVSGEAKIGVVGTL